MQNPKNAKSNSITTLLGLTLSFGAAIAALVGMFTVENMTIPLGGVFLVGALSSGFLGKALFGVLVDSARTSENNNSDLRFASIENLNNCVLLTDGETRISYINTAMHSFLRGKETVIREQNPSFDAGSLVGKPLSTIHEGLSCNFVKSQDIVLEMGDSSIKVHSKKLFDSESGLLGISVELAEVDEKAENSSEKMQRLQIKTALDVCQANVMLADNDLNIVYANDSVVSMLRARKEPLSEKLPKLDVENLVGVCVDDFHEKPSHQRSMIARLTEVYKTSLKIGDLTFQLIATPMFDELGERIGTVVEWQDKTDQLLAEREAKIVSDANARVKQALDNCQANVMLADNDLNIIYSNDSANAMMSNRESVIKQHISGFDASSLVGTCVDDFHKHPSHQREMIANMREVYKTRLPIGELNFDLIATPLFDDEGARLGTIVEWTDMTDALLQEARLNVIADENARIRQALDSASSNVMLADEDNVITYMNQTVSEMFVEAESDIKKDLPAFEARSLVGKSMDVFHKHPGHQQHVISNLTSTIESEAKVGGRTYVITTTPLIAEGGKRLGTVVEWLDRTLALSIEEGVLGEVKETVDAAIHGVLSKRIDLAGKEGFYATLSTSINQLVELFDHVVEEVLLVSSNLAEGDLTRKVEGDYEGTFGELKNQLNATIDGLTEAMDSIKSAAETVSSGAEEISQGNTNLSNRTENQASSLEETASSMEEMTSTVQQNAENARDADRLALEAREKAEHGGKIVGNAVTAMSEINSASKRIADIISVIDEIAFQTNLLALNASVEAARAGEQGRGFAVVASEVRNLAGRSATAAKEIKELIEDSVSKVTEGSKLVDESGKTLEEIIAEVQKVTNVVGEISAASAEQATGIEEVNRAITQMDEMTQQNAALVEEAAAASELVGQQSADLKHQVAYFKTGSSSTNESVPRSPAKLKAVAGSRPPERASVRKQAVNEVPHISSASSSGIGGTDWEEF
ncbi:MAG: methyl-accepting chemotaxis protein [Pseudohongiellaceae bacterium]